MAFALQEKSEFEKNRMLWDNSFKGNVRECKALMFAGANVNSVNEVLTASFGLGVVYAKQRMCALITSAIERAWGIVKSAVAREPTYKLSAAMEKLEQEFRARLGPEVCKKLCDKVSITAKEYYMHDLKQYSPDGFAPDRMCARPGRAGYVSRRGLSPPFMWQRFTICKL